MPLRQACVPIRPTYLTRAPNAYFNARCNSGYVEVKAAMSIHIAFCIFFSVSDILCCDNGCNQRARAATTRRAARPTILWIGHRAVMVYFFVPNIIGYVRSPTVVPSACQHFHTSLPAFLLFVTKLNSCSFSREAEQNVSIQIIFCDF